MKKKPMIIVSYINKEKEDFIKLNVQKKKEEVIIPEKVKKKNLKQNLKTSIHN